MNNDIATPNNTKNGKAMAGVIILAIGAILLVQQFNFFFIPDWLFSWPMWLIGWGLYMGAKHNYQKPSWAFMILIGIAFLITDNVANADDVVWPVGLIILGAWIAFRPAKQADKDFWNKNEKAKAHFDFDKTTTTTNHNI